MSRKERKFLKSESRKSPAPKRPPRGLGKFSAVGMDVLDAWQIIIRLDGKCGLLSPRSRSFVSPDDRRVDQGGRGLN